MKIWRRLVLFAVLLAMLLSFGSMMPSKRTTVAAQDQECPPPEVIAAQRELLEGIIDEFIAVRAYKDATLNELARLNVLYYSLRGEYLRALLERYLLIAERDAILENATLSPADIERLIEIEDRLLELSVLLEGANESIQEQLLLLAVLWQPVVDFIVGVSVERYERYTQRILEVRRGEGEEALALAQEILNAMLACEGEEVPPGQLPPTPSGVGT